MLFNETVTDAINYTWAAFTGKSGESEVATWNSAIIHFPVYNYILQKVCLWALNSGACTAHKRMVRRLNQVTLERWYVQSNWH